MFYADQMRLPFVFRESLIISTLHLTIRATGEQVALPGVVFRGAGTRITQWEKDHYPPNVRIYWQANAWVDTVAMDQITDDFLTDVADIEGGVMLGVDNIGAHHDSNIKTKLVAADVFPVFTPTQCKDVISPVDHHVGNWMKEAMAVMYGHELERNLEMWENGELTAAERRIYIANWVGTAWTELKTMPKFIRKSFVSTGWLLAKDGSENHLVKLKKYLKDYGFPRL